MMNITLMENRENQNTTIALRIQTKENLANIAKKGQTYDDIIKYLLTNWNESK